MIAGPSSSFARGALWRSCALSESGLQLCGSAALAPPLGWRPGDTVGGGHSARATGCSLHDAVSAVSGKAVEGLVNAAFELPLRNRIVESVFTVFLFEVVEPFFSSRLHPYTSLRESIRHLRRPVRSVKT